MSTLGEVIASMRTLRQMTQRELGDRAGMSALTISRTERNVSKPHSSDVLRIISGLAKVMPVTESELAALVDLGYQADVLAPHAAASPTVTASSRRTCEVLLSELLNGVPPQAVAQTLHALIALRNARPVAKPIPVSAPTPGPTLRHVDTTRIPPTEAIRDQPSGTRALSAADLRAAHVAPMRIAISEGPMPGVPGATEIRYQPISTVAAQLSESLDLPAAQIAAAIRKALKA